MIFYGVATVRNKTQLDNLCECIRILGGDPKSSLNDVVVEFEGTEDECDIFTKLFEHYPDHGIYTEK